MTAQIIDGKLLAQEVQQGVAAEVAEMVAKGLPRPGLATVLVGENPAAKSYVSSKQKACAELGMQSFGFHLPATVSQFEVESLVAELNADPRVNGILVQLPLPSRFVEEDVLKRINIEKDVDAFHPMNTGRLAQIGRDPLFVPCTPAGCLLILDKLGVPLQGTNAVVLGCSNVVGMPMALLLVRRWATVTICHIFTQNLPDIVRRADVLIVAVGHPELVRGSWVKPGAVVIDVGINRIEDPEHPKGSRLVGDVCFEEVKEVASAITPVPGGVGPMTIAMLMQNTLQAAKIANQ